MFEDWNGEPIKNAIISPDYKVMNVKYMSHTYWCEQIIIDNDWKDEFMSMSNVDAYDFISMKGYTRTHIINYGDKHINAYTPLGVDYNRIEELLKGNTLPYEITVHWCDGYNAAEWEAEVDRQMEWENLKHKGE